MKELTKEIPDLTNKEILEDLEYWIYEAQMRSPSFVDEIFDIVRKYIEELKERFK